MEKLYSTLKEISESNLIDYQNENYEDKYLSIDSRSLNFSKDIKDIFEEIYQKKNIDKSLDQLRTGKFLSKTENRSISHVKNRQSIDLFIKKDLPTIRVLKEDLIKKNINNILILGTGGSFEGPKLLLETFSTEASEDFAFSFITGPDETEFKEKTKLLDPKKTIFIVSSKSLSTTETLESLSRAKNWLNKEIGKNSKSHLFAVTSNENKAKELFYKENVFLFDSGIGGRYSIWSMISLPALLAADQKIINFIKGGLRFDELFFKNKNLKEFIKKISFQDIWNNNFLNFKNRILLSYSWPIRSLPDYFQQLEMESLGKPNNIDSIFEKTSQIIFGAFGPKAQHSFFQELHQGTNKYCVDLISNKKDRIDNNLISKQLSAQKILFEKNLDEFKNTPIEVNANSLFNHFELSDLDAINIGYLIALWEYRTFITANMLGINPFDQFGVEAGKKISNSF